MDTDETLKSVLSRTGASVYPLQRPADSPIPAIVYRRISETGFVTHQGAVLLQNNRFQITHVASSYTLLRQLVKSVKTQLLGNKTDFNASVASTVHLEKKEAENIFTCSKDYFIWN